MPPTMLTLSTDEDDDVPLSRRPAPAAAPKRGVARPRKKPAALEYEGEDDEEVTDEGDADVDDDEDEEDDKPLGKRKAAAKKESAARGTKRKRGSNGEDSGGGRKGKKAAAAPPAKGGGKGGKGSVKWKTLVHSGVLFPPEYVPHGVKMLYEGKPVDLTPAQEEVATFYAIKLDTDYVKKDKFRENFWDDFKRLLGSKHVIKDFSKCDFRPIYEHQMRLREEKKAMSKEEKQRLKEEKEQVEAKFKFALVDGRKEQVGNFRVEPPSLFLGRGEHPKQGHVKRRIYPRDITINIGQGAPTPTHPYPDQTWKEVRHDNTVTWLAFWHDPISKKDFKYVWLAANSTFKTESDLAKYEKARRLKDHIKDIRKQYEQDMNNQADRQARQMAVALYFIDVLALRAGHDKDDAEEADTVGCCTLKVENVACLDNHQIKFDFLGKDSIRYENVVTVMPKVYQNIKDFMKGKKGGEQLFDTFDATDLNNKLKELMDGLSAKVFRTYNASITLDEQLHQLMLDRPFPDADEDPVRRKNEYDTANKEVAILCNHQRSVPKTFEGSMQRLDERIQAVRVEVQETQELMRLAKKGEKEVDGKKIKEDQLAKKIERLNARINKLEQDKESRENLKTVALGTSKINYMDPRITVAYCKRVDLPIEKLFNKSLLAKFAWAMEVEPDFRF